jgi:hypothetical protein
MTSDGRTLVKAVKEFSTLHRSDDQPYRELGTDRFKKRSDEQRTLSLVKQLESLGYTVKLKSA